MVAKVGDKYTPDFPKTIDERGREILHCPNCGSIKVAMQRDVGASYVECEGCEMRVVGYRRRKNAIRIWNKTGRGVPCGLEI